MYEILIKWGLDTLKSLAGDELKHQDSLVIEAIRTKNSLVKERFNIAQETILEFQELTVELERELQSFQDKFLSKTDGEDFSKYLGRLKRNFHPKFYRKFRKIRTRLGMTNDALSGYSLALIRLVNISFVEEIAEEKKLKNPSDISRTYRMSWTFLLSTLTALLRITTNDLRFWLTDKSYSEKAYNWAIEYEIPAIKKFLIDDNKGKTVYFITLTNSDNLEKFWKK